MSNRRYVGWLVIEPRGESKVFVCEVGQGSERKRVQFTDVDAALAFLDRRAGMPVILQDTPLGAYRAYTEVPNDESHH